MDLSTAKNQKMEWLVGVFVLLGIVMLGVIILAFGQFQDRFRPRYDVKVFFPDASGLLSGADVKLGGAKVGTVASAPELNENYDGVIVTLRIFNEVKIPETSAISISQSGLLGDSFINIRPPRTRTDAFIDPEGTGVQTGLARTGAGIDGLQDTATQVADRATLALTELERTLQTFNKTLKRVDENLLNDVNIAKFTSTMDNMAQASEKISVAADKLSPLLEKGEGTLTEARATLASTRKVMEDLKPAIADLSPALKELAPALREIRPAVAEIKPALLGLQPALKEVQDAAEKTSSTMAAITGGDGLLPALLTDRTLKADTENFLSNVRRYGILFYKDREQTAEQERPGPLRRGRGPRSAPGR